jgi:hypothetical protein
MCINLLSLTTLPPNRIPRGPHSQGTTTIQYYSVCANNIYEQTSEHLDLEVGAK